MKTIVAAAEAHKHGQTSAEDLARLTFKEICYQFGLSQNLTMDNKSVRFENHFGKSVAPSFVSLLVTIRKRIQLTSPINRSSKRCERQ